MNIFIDIGAHKGESCDIFLKHKPNFNVVCFEPDPRNQKIIKQKGYDLMNGAAWKYDGKIKLYTGLQESNSVYSTKRTGGINKYRFIWVQCFDLAKFIKNNYKKEDHIIIKMNCEGAEYNLIPHLKNNDLLSWVNEWYVQWHWNKIGVSQPLHNHIKGMINSKPWYAMMPKKFKL